MATNNKTSSCYFMQLTYGSKSVNLQMLKNLWNMVAAVANVTSLNFSFIPFAKNLIDRKSHENWGNFVLKKPDMIMNLTILNFFMKSSVFSSNLSWLLLLWILDEAPVVALFLLSSFILDFKSFKSLISGLFYHKTKQNSFKKNLF